MAPTVKIIEIGKKPRKLLDEICECVSEFLIVMTHTFLYRFGGYSSVEFRDYSFGSSVAAKTDFLVFDSTPPPCERIRDASVPLVSQIHDNGSKLVRRLSYGVEQGPFQRSERSKFSGVSFSWLHLVQLLVQL
ncbi:hypothetical protein GCK32_011604 [Trichostrongylus colubriformis]|uniref:Uncharacterized protein n=1 Tax=Trichostrongylus colubriformis TaxID=6319 RepID=A0AAN8IDQ8_TRICO